MEETVDGLTFIAFFLRSVLEKDKKLSGINDKNTHYLSFISDKMITFTPD